MVERSTNVAHRPMLIVSPFMAFQHIAVDVGDHGVRVYDALVDVGYKHMSIYPELDLRVISWQ